MDTYEKIERYNESFENLANVSNTVIIESMYVTKTVIIESMYVWYKWFHYCIGRPTG